MHEEPVNPMAVLRDLHARLPEDATLDRDVLAWAIERLEGWAAAFQAAQLYNDRRNDVN